MVFCFVCMNEGIRRASKKVPGARFCRHRGADVQRKRHGVPYGVVKSAENPYSAVSQYEAVKSAENPYSAVSQRERIPILSVN